MSSLPTPSPAYGINPDTLLSSFPIISTPITSESPNGFARLVRLMQSNERLFAEQRALAVKLQRARADLADPNANPSLEKANLQHLKTKYSGILALLRANRREAQALRARLDSKPRREGEPCPSQADPSSVLSAVRDPRHSPTDLQSEMSAEKAAPASPGPTGPPSDLEESFRSDIGRQRVTLGDEMRHLSRDWA